jgi:hypothetical protein
MADDPFPWWEVLVDWAPYLDGAPPDIDELVKLGRWLPIREAGEVSPWRVVLQFPVRPRVAPVPTPGVLHLEGDKAPQHELVEGWKVAFISGRHAPLCYATLTRIYEGGRPLWPDERRRVVWTL